MLVGEFICYVMQLNGFFFFWVSIFAMKTTYKTGNSTNLCLVFENRKIHLTILCFGFVILVLLTLWTFGKVSYFF
jgi:hypothetical protein